MLLERLQRSALRLDQERRSLAAARGVDPGSVSSAILVRHRPEAGALIEELEAVVREIERDGAQLKDVALGLVDFPCELDGELVLLCWQFGETEVAFWHREGDCFAFFFFSSRRRHTRFSRDWSSEVCSSDLASSPSGESRRTLCRVSTPERR